MELLLRYLIIGCLASLIPLVCLVIVVIALILFVIPVLALVLWATFDIVRFEIVTAWRNYRSRGPSPQRLNVKPWRRWKVSATLQQIKDEFLRPAVCYDSDAVDDPLSPHVSIIYMVGMKKFASYWHTITIWRVSTITGRRQCVSRFIYCSRIPFYKLIRLQLGAFFSKGVVFILLRYQWWRWSMVTDDFTTLLIYDIRFDAWVEIDMGWCQSLRPLKFETFCLILCMGRRMEGSKLEGWRIRLLAAAIEKDDALIKRRRLANVTIDIAASSPESAVTVSREDLVFPFAQYHWMVRTSTCKIGLLQSSGIFLYDAMANRFERLENLQNLYASDAVVRKYRFRRMANKVTYLRNSAPMVLNGREAIQCKSPFRVIMRTSLGTPTLRMAAVQSLFKRAEIRKMTADDFRKETGVDVTGHLRAKENRSGWKFW